MVSFLLLQLNRIKTSDGSTLSQSSGTGTLQGSVPSALPAATAASVNPVASGGSSVPGLANITNLEGVKRAQEVAARLGFRQDPHYAPVINFFPGQVSTELVVPQKPTKAPVLRVDALGREIDDQGNVVNVSKPNNLSTLKVCFLTVRIFVSPLLIFCHQFFCPFQISFANLSKFQVNINKQKKDAFQILKPELDVDPESNPHFDPRMGVNKTKILRPKRMTFQFVEEGKWSKEAEMLKVKVHISIFIFSPF